MELAVKEIGDLRLIALTHRGPYPTIGATFGQLAEMVGRHAIPVGDFVAVYYDNPFTTPPEELRSHAGAIVPPDYQPEGVDVEIVTVPGGKYATGIHVGSYEKMSDGWMDLCGNLMPAAGLSSVDDGRAPFERYIKDCDVEGMDRAETEIYVPI